jgi:adenosine deaminase
VVIANRYRSLAEHPLRRMRDAGLLVTINTDDPAMTGTDLGREYRDVAEALGYDYDEMCRIAVEGIDATWLSEAERRDLRHSFEATIAQLVARA